MRTSTRFTLTILAMLATIGFQSGAHHAAQSPATQRTPVFVAIYDRGPAWDESKGTLQQTGIAEHSQFLRANSAKLIAAAPFQQALAPGGSDRTVGMVITLAATQEEAESLIAGDPAIAGKLMTATVRRWLVDRVKNY